MRIRSRRENQEQNSKQQIMGAPKGYSNLIFNSNCRAVSALSSTHSQSKIRSREQNIMLLRKSKKDSHLSNIQSERHSKSTEIYIEPYNNNGINIINLISCSTTGGQKLKSNYCKKITLTNVQKYYESCVKKVKSIISGSVNQAQCPEQKQLKTNNKNLDISQDSQSLLVSTHLKKTNSCDFKNYSPDSFQGDGKSNIIQIPYFSQFSKKMTSALPLRKNMNNLYSKQTKFHRNIYTSMCLRQKKYQNRQANNTSQRSRIFRNDPKNKKQQFILDAWQSVENAQDDIF